MRMPSISRLKIRRSLLVTSHAVEEFPDRSAAVGELSVLQRLMFKCVRWKEREGRSEVALKRCCRCQDG